MQKMRGCMVRVYKNQGGCGCRSEFLFAPMSYASIAHSCKGSRSFGGTWQWVDGDGDGDLEFLLAWYENVRYYYQTSPSVFDLNAHENIGEPLFDGNSGNPSAVVDLNNDGLLDYIAGDATDSECFSTRIIRQATYNIMPPLVHSIHL